MKDVFVLLAHFLTTVARILGPGGTRAVMAESLLVKQQLLIVTRSRQRVPNLTVLDRFLLAFWSLFLPPGRIPKSTVAIRPATILKFHRCLLQRKYRALFSSPRTAKPGPKGPTAELVQAIVELKRRNPRFGCPRIALIISKTFGIGVDKDVVRRVLARHYRPVLADASSAAISHGSRVTPPLTPGQPAAMKAACACRSTTIIPRS